MGLIFSTRHSEVWYCFSLCSKPTLNVHSTFYDRNIQLQKYFKKEVDLLGTTVTFLLLFFFFSVGKLTLVNCIEDFISIQSFLLKRFIYWERLFFFCTNMNSVHFLRDVSARNVILTFISSLFFLRFIDLCTYTLESTEKFHLRHPFSLKINIKFKGFSLSRAMARTCNNQQFNVSCFLFSHYCGIVDT